MFAFATLKPEFKYDPNDESGLIKELTLQVRKVIGPFAAPKRIFIVIDLPKTRSGKVRPHSLFAEVRSAGLTLSPRSCGACCGRSSRARATSSGT